MKKSYAVLMYGVTFHPSYAQAVMATLPEDLTIEWLKRPGEEPTMGVIGIPESQLIADDTEPLTVHQVQLNRANVEWDDRIRDHIMRSLSGWMGLDAKATAAQWLLFSARM